MRIRIPLVAGRSDVPWHERRAWRRAMRRTPDSGPYADHIQVCPRACGYSEHARRVLVMRTRLSGRAEARTRFEFETRNCPTCGGRLLRECPRCAAPILSGPESRCRNCGAPQIWARDRQALRSVRRNWRRTAEHIADVGSQKLWMFGGDITAIELHRGAVVSTDDIDGTMWGDVALAIRDAAGHGVERESVERGPYRLGDAWVTESGALPGLAIVHTASMDAEGLSSLPVVEACVRSVIERACEAGLATLAMPVIGSGTSGLDVMACTSAIVEAAVHSLRGRTCELRDVVIVVFERPEFAPIVAAARSAAVHALR